MAQNPPLTLLTETEFRSSRYGDVADSVNAKLSTLIAQAEDYVENYVDRRLARATHVEQYRGCQKWLFVRQYPVTEIVDVRVRPTRQSEWDLLDVEDFIIPHPDIPQLEYVGSRDIRNHEIEITYEAGYAPIPQIIQAAVILQTVIFANVDIEVYGIGDGKEPGILYLQRQVHDYMCPYKRIRRFY